jgi:hypothetical protein
MQRQVPNRSRTTRERARIIGNQKSLGWDFVYEMTVLNDESEVLVFRAPG